eukprot:scaffold65652_cov71-Phaeocystis_antarctica.AAC.8
MPAVDDPGRGVSSAQAQGQGQGRRRARLRVTIRLGLRAEDKASPHTWKRLPSVQTPPWTKSSTGAVVVAAPSVGRKTSRHRPGVSWITSLGMRRSRRGCSSGRATAVARSTAAFAGRLLWWRNRCCSLEGRFRSTKPSGSFSMCERST